ncbi:MAG: thiamine phosphate synthase [Planctomycetes bacterium]|nr:thiamine phosphate synthase [Planctomycetota bacterium]
MSETSQRTVALRILDANRNRVLEGLRTLEDLARFHSFPELQAAYKGYRHTLLEASSGWDSNGMLAARNADEDVGRTQKTAAERDRSNGLEAIAATASGRVEQGLRVLEETAKFAFPSSSGAIESIRYRVYDTNAKLRLALAHDASFFGQAKLYVLVDCQLPLRQFLDRLREMSAAGVGLIQIRDKQSSSETLLAYSRSALDALDDRRTRVIMNDRVDLAQITNVWGVHVGQEDIPPRDAVALLGSHKIVGWSTHDVDQVRKAIEQRVDYIGCGPTFPSHTKSFHEFAGTGFLREAQAMLMENNAALPAYAIGGIHSGNLQEVLETGFTRVAVSSAVWGAENPGKAAERIRRFLD